MSDAVVAPVPAARPAPADATAVVALVAGELGLGDLTVWFDLEDAVALAGSLDRFLALAREAATATGWAQPETGVYAGAVVLYDKGRELSVEEAARLMTALG